MSSDRSTATQLHGKPATSERPAKNKQSDEPKLTDDAATQPNMLDDYVLPAAPALSVSDDHVSRETLNTTHSVNQSPRLQPADEADSNDYENDIDNLYITVLDFDYYVFS